MKTRLLIIRVVILILGSIAIGLYTANMIKNIQNQEAQEKWRENRAIIMFNPDPKPYTQSIITIQDRLPDRTIVPITITQLTLNAESLDTITEYNFSILNVIMRSLGGYWGNLPNQYITNEMVDEHGNNIVNYDMVPDGKITYKLSQATYPATCDDGTQIKGMGAYPEPILIINGSSDVYFQKGSLGIYPNGDEKYSLEFVSGYETTIHHPNNVSLEFHQTQKCNLDKTKNGFDDVYYTSAVFSFNDEH